MATTNTPEPQPGYPTCFVPDITDRIKVFDPALRHYPRGFRQGDPLFYDELVRLYWEWVNHQAMLHLLRVTKAASWKDGPILRGSMVLRHHLGEISRPPRDLDWIVLPASLKPDSKFVKLFFEDITARLRREPAFEGGEFQPDEIRYDEIWVYDKSPGQRIIFPWRGENLPRGLVQMDFAFQEPLPSEPVVLDIPGAGAIRTASLEQLLEWKLFWLGEDSYPQGKDLYDATLIAEHLRAMGRPYSYPTPDLMDSSVYWDDFMEEYPETEGDVASWAKRLSAALTL